MTEKLELSTSPEQISQEEAQRQIGAASLALVNFQDRHKDIVDSSFNKAKADGERISGKNNERKNYAYLSRLENLIEKHGNSLEKQLWQASAQKVIIKPSDITESYWKKQEQNLRDNGRGRKLNDHEKSILTEDIQKQQKESLESWINYLGDKNSPYPLWFKIYAWDGMTKMGVFDKEKGHFAKRDEHTVAPYPKLNPAVLAKTYSAVAEFYGLEGSERYQENEENTEALRSLVKSGNFNKLYSRILLNEKAIPRTPERTEDIRGEWIEYLPGQEENLANAAEGTPWCVADAGTGKNYLEYGNFCGQNDEDYDDEYDDRVAWIETNNSQSDKNHAKFILFHLYDPEKNTLSESACASIRLDTDGRVAEISGLNDGQALEDSLIPIVEEKVKTLPGSEDFLEAFADKQELIRLDRKMQNNEKLSKEDLEFVYEINHPIKTLDTYNDEDPRIAELREKYGLQDLLESGIDINEIIQNTDIDVDSSSIIKNLDALLDRGADINEIINMLSYVDIHNNLDLLFAHGADVSYIIDRLDGSCVDCLDLLLSHGADINEIVKKIGKLRTLDHLDLLLSHGADIDVNELAVGLSADLLLKYSSVLTNHGIDIDADKLKLVRHLDDDPETVMENLDVLITHGVKVDIDKLMSDLGPSRIACNLDTLVNHGADIDVDELVSNLDPEDIVENLDTLINHGANIDVDELARHLDYNSEIIVYNLDTLINHGANIDINELVRDLYTYDNPGIIADNLDALVKHGANIDVNQLLEDLGPHDISRSLDALVSHGANIDRIIHKLSDIGYTIDDIVNRLDPRYVAENFDILRAHGYRR